MFRVRILLPHSDDLPTAYYEQGLELHRKCLQKLYTNNRSVYKAISVIGLSRIIEQCTTNPVVICVKRGKRRGVKKTEGNNSTLTLPTALNLPRVQDADQ
jgi:hypothetical protein